MAQEKERGLLALLSQSLFVAQDKVKDHGEDSYLIGFHENAGVCAVFDGLGGSGSRQYKEYGDKTGAYVASRAVSEELYNWFRAFSEDQDGLSSQKIGESLRGRIDKRLSACQEGGIKKSSLKSTMTRDFPTTLSMLVFRPDGQGSISANVIWAGDSRSYLLGGDGLHQLTLDDTSKQDAYEALYKDAAMNNVISASEPYTLSEYILDGLSRGIAFSATDGCFGYLQSPMHFEYLLLDSMLGAENLSDMEKSLHERLVKLAGDDFTLTGAIFGFESFGQMKAYYRKRYEVLFPKYIEHFRESSKEQRLDLWNEYRGGYEKYMPAKKG
ncbi:MAG: protein phosphatase 2C domain-containing protein [Blautia sp.]|nr:protein phosphatase 2C domain-containing protein [Blautia sp.]